jgi:hypothetical protein
MPSPCGGDETPREHSPALAGSPSEGRPGEWLHQMDVGYTPSMQIEYVKPSGAAAFKFGSWKFDVPFPPYSIPSSENSALYCAIGSV